MKNVREMLVKQVIRQEMNDVLGGLENSLMDKLIEEMPPREEIAEMVYSQVMKQDVVEFPSGIISVKKDIRFIGSERIRAHIEKRLMKEGY